MDFDCDKCLVVESETMLSKKTLEGDAKKGELKKSLRVLTDKDSYYSYLPRRLAENTVLYSSEHVYCLTRYLYALYERLIKMREVAGSE